jgi:hypothetical protein
MWGVFATVERRFLRVVERCAERELEEGIDGGSWAVKRDALALGQSKSALAKHFSVAGDVSCTMSDFLFRSPRRFHPNFSRRVLPLQ